LTIGDVKKSKGRRREARQGRKGKKEEKEADREEW
jgi:hypothetical protein